MDAIEFENQLRIRIAERQRDLLKQELMLHGYQEKTIDERLSEVQ